MYEYLDVDNNDDDDGTPSTTRRERQQTTIVTTPKHTAHACQQVHHWTRLHSFSRPRSRITTSRFLATRRATMKRWQCPCAASRIICHLTTGRYDNDFVYVIYSITKIPSRSLMRQPYYYWTAMPSSSFVYYYYSAAAAFSTKTQSCADSVLMQAMPQSIASNNIPPHLLMTIHHFWRNPLRVSIQCIWHASRFWNSSMR